MGFVPISPDSTLSPPSTKNSQQPENKTVTKQKPSLSAQPTGLEGHADSVQFRSVSFSFITETCRFWQHEEMIGMARDAIREFEKHPRPLSLPQIAKLFDLASILGRRAARLPLDPADEEPLPTAFDEEMEKALRKVYGQKIDDDPPSTQPSPSAPNPRLSRGHQLASQYNQGR